MISPGGSDDEHEIGSMTSPLATLEAEHRLILRVIHALEGWAGSFVDSDADGRDTLRRFMRFFREFAEGCHHRKEEQVLFTTMERYGFLVDEAPIATMLVDHEEGRKYLDDLAAMAEQGTPWTVADRREVSREAHNYALFLEQHIASENKELYPQAENRLPERCWDLVALEFEQIEEQSSHPEGHEDPIVLAKNLVAEFSKAVL